jgi:YbbR domain-containing protein
MMTFLRTMLLDNWAMKLLSLALSLTLWFYVTSTGKTELTMTVPIELRNIPPGMTVVGDVSGSLEARIQGQERVLRESTAAKKIVARLDLSVAREGENSIPVSPDDIKRPGGTTVTHLSQYDVKVKLERLVRRTLRVRPVLRGTPAAGFRLAGTSVSPGKVVIEGPASVMQALEKLETMPIDIQQARESLTVEPRIDYQGKPVKLLEKNIAVHVNIKRTDK